MQPHTPYVARRLSFYDSVIAYCAERRREYMAIARRHKALGYTSPSGAVRLARNMNRYLCTWLKRREDFLRARKFLLTNTHRPTILSSSESTPV